jgi:hypothetical protein
MRHYLALILIIILTLSCSNAVQKPVQIDTVFSIDDVAKMGIKMKGEFVTEFPEATDAKWGFSKGREVAVFRYESTEKARDSGKIAAEEQTKLIEVVEKNIAHGPKVEKTKCRGDAYGGNPYKLIPNYKVGYRDALILNKNTFIELDVEIEKNSVRDGCVRREPMFIEFRVYGNLVILIEPMPEEDRPAMNKVIDELIAKLP